MFSESSIKKLQPRSTPYRVFDSCGIAGFGVQVTPAGGKGYFLRYAEQGKSRYLSLGHHPHTPLSSAREKARQARSKLDQGVPLVDVPAQAATMEALLKAWLEHQTANGRRRLSDVERTIRFNVPSEILSIPAQSVSPEQIRTVLATIHQRGSRVSANRVRSRLHAMFQYGLLADHDPRRMADPVLFGITINPVSAIPRDAGAENARERVLSWAEIREFWNSEELSWLARQACRLLLLTGQRVNEVVQANYAEMDINGQLWTLPAGRSKNHRTHLIPLSPQVITVITELHDVFPGDWLFPARNVPGAKAPWGNSALAHAVLRWQRDAGSTDCWRPQDLRRTMKTWAVSAGIERGILDKVQNHALSDVASKHYDKHSYTKEKAVALNQWAAELTARMAGDNVVALPIRKQATRS